MGCVRKALAVVPVWLQELACRSAVAGRALLPGRGLLCAGTQRHATVRPAGPDQKRGACRDRGGGLCPRSRGALVSATTLAYFTHASS